MSYYKKYKKYKTKYEDMVDSNYLITRYVIDNVDLEYLNILISNFKLDNRFFTKSEIVTACKQINKKIQQINNLPKRLVKKCYYLSHKSVIKFLSSMGESSSGIDLEKKVNDLKKNINNPSVSHLLELTKVKINPKSRNYRLAENDDYFAKEMLKTQNAGSSILGFTPDYMLWDIYLPKLITFAIFFVISKKISGSSWNQWALLSTLVLPVIKSLNINILLLSLLIIVFNIDIRLGFSNDRQESNISPDNSKPDDLV